MAKILKYTLITVLSLVALITVIIGGIFVFVDPNEYKGEITAAVQNATGRQLTITGDIRFSIYPWLGLSLGSTQLSNARGFGDTPFASVENVDIKIKLLPLLHQRREMQKIRLHGLRASLAKDKDGRTNWDDLSAPSTPSKTATTKPSKTTTAPGATESSQPAVALAALTIDGLELENAQLEWNDQQANQHITISNLTLRTGVLALSAPVDLSLSLDVKIKNPDVGGHVDFAAQVSFDLENQQYHANNLNLTVKAAGAGLPVSPLDAHLLANVKADLKQQQINLGSLKLNTLGTNITGQATITGLDKSPTASGHIAVAEFSPREVTKKLGITLPETRDASVLTKVNLKVDFAGNMDGASLTKITAVLDDSTLTGNVKVINFAVPAVRYDIKLNEIDADRYLPPASETPAATPASPGTAAAAATQLPLEPLRALDIQGELHLGKLKIAGARLTDINLRTNARNGHIKLNPITANLYDGSYKGDIAMDVRSDTPKLAFNETLKGLHIGPLLNDVMGKGMVSGTAYINAELTSSGSDLETIKKSLNGKANFSFHDGAVKGVNIAQMIREANAKLNKKPAPPKVDNKTDFTEMTGSVTVTNGLVRNDDLTAKTPLLRIRGDGSVDLPTEKIKYLINASIVESVEGQAGKDLNELKSLTIPIKVTGTFDNPKYGLDLGPALKAQTKKAVDKKVETEKKKIRKNLEDKLKKQLGIKF